MRHNNVSKVHIQKFIAEVESGAYPAPDVFVFSMGTNDRNLGSAEEALKGKTLDEVDVNTMAGGARWSIQTILEHYPQCRVFRVHADSDRQPRTQCTESAEDCHLA